MNLVKKNAESIRTKCILLMVPTKIFQVGQEVESIIMRRCTLKSSFPNITMLFQNLRGAKYGIKTSRKELEREF